MADTREFFAERRRRAAMAAARAAGEFEWSTDLNDSAVRAKLDLAWNDALVRRGYRDGTQPFNKAIQSRGLRSLGKRLSPLEMPHTILMSTDDALSLIEVEHSVLADHAAGDDVIVDPLSVELTRLAPSDFAADVNRIFEAHGIGYRLGADGEIVPLSSTELHSAVVVPALDELRLLDNEPAFQAAEAAYQNALREIRNGDPDDAITDAASALQDALIAAGCTGNALGDLLKSARRKGILTAADTPLNDALNKIGSWVATRRNNGEAHTGAAAATIDDAWLIVHVVGALIVHIARKHGAHSAADNDEP